MRQHAARNGQAPAMPDDALVRVENLSVHFPSAGAGFLGLRKAAPTRAVDDVSFTIRPGETLGLVGESGSGKSTTGRAILNLVPPTTGSVYYREQAVSSLRGAALRRFRTKAQIIFQDPYSALDPRMTIGNMIAEPLRVHKLAPKGGIKARVQELLSTVGLNPDFINRYPHEFSGGQQQRIGIGRALALNPDFIVCDEPISSLDVSIQAQIINLLVELQETKGIAYLFIAHDLRVVRVISTQVAVMYRGKIVELAPSDELYDNPLHPYTQALLSAVPTTDPDFEDQRTYTPYRGEPHGSEGEHVFREVRPGHFVAVT